jgi:superfamily II DNA/RNA helicase
MALITCCSKSNLINFFSGKTLAFLIPLLERLFRNRFSTSDGAGAIVLSPTRELAVQIFDVLREIGAYHAFTAGLLVGGKKEFHLEQRHVGRTNIIIATPGRLLQHLEQTPDLDTSNLQVLVLDEAGTFSLQNAMAHIGLFLSRCFFGETNSNFTVV